MWGKFDRQDSAAEIEFFIKQVLKRKSHFHLHMKRPYLLEIRQTQCGTIAVVKHVAQFL